MEFAALSFFVFLLAEAGTSTVEMTVGNIAVQQDAQEQIRISYDDANQTGELNDLGLDTSSARLEIRGGLCSCFSFLPWCKNSRGRRQPNVKNMNQLLAVADNTVAYQRSQAPPPPPPPKPRDAPEVQIMGH